MTQDSHPALDALKDWNNQNDQALGILLEYTYDDLLKRAERQLAKADRLGLEPAELIALTYEKRLIKRRTRNLKELRDYLNWVESEMKLEMLDALAAMDRKKRGGEFQFHSIESILADARKSQDG